MDVTGDAIYAPLSILYNLEVCHGAAFTSYACVTCRTLLVYSGLSTASRSMSVRSPFPKDGSRITYPTLLVAHLV